DDAVAADRHALRARRDRDRGLERVAARRYELTVRVELKRPVAGIGLRAVGQPDLEEAPALDRDVERVVRRDEVALRELLVRRDDAHAGAEIQARRRLALLRREPARLHDVLIQEILEHRAGALVSGRVDVREILRDHGHARLLRLETGLRYP